MSNKYVTKKYFDGYVTIQVDEHAVFTGKRIALIVLWAVMILAFVVGLFFVAVATTPKHVCECPTGGLP